MRRYVFLLISCGQLGNWCMGQQPTLVFPMGHTWWVNSAVFSPDEKRILTTSDDGTAKIWDATTGRLLLTLNGGTSWIKTAYFSPDGRRVLTSSFYTTAKLWDAVSGQLIKELLNGSEGRYGAPCAVYSPDGQKIVTANGGSINVWDASTGAYLNTIYRNKEPSNIQTIQFSPDGKSILTTEYRSDINILDFSTGKIIRELGFNNTTGRRTHGYLTEFSRDGRMVLNADFDNKAYVWEVSSGRLIASFQVTTGRDGRKVVTAAKDKLIKIWDAASGKLLTTAQGHTSKVNSAIFSPDNKKIVSASDDKTIRIWDAFSGRTLFTLREHQATVTGASFNRDGKSILSTSGDFTAKLWDTDAGVLKADVAGHTMGFRSASYSRDGTRIITASSDNTAKIWDVLTGNILVNLKGHTGRVNDAALSPDGKRAATVSRDSSVKVWDAMTGKLLYTIKGRGGHLGYVNSVQFSPDGTKLVTTSDDQTAKYWEVATGRLIKSFEGAQGHHGAVTYARFSPDGSKIVTISLDHEGRVWDTRRLQWISSLNGHGLAQINSADFSSDGNTVITAAHDGIFYLWDVPTGKPKQQYFNYFTDPEWKITYARFFPSGNMLLAIGLDNTVKIMDLDTKRILVKISGMATQLSQVTISPDRTRIMGNSLDGPAIIWRARNGYQVCSFFTVDDKDYVIQLPDGYYHSTPGAAKLLHYVTKDLRVISFEQLDVKYNRPDKVLEALGNPDAGLINTYRNAYHKRIQRLGIDTSSFGYGYSVPEADFVNRDGIRAMQTNEILSLHIRGSDNSYALDRFNIWVNEVPVFGQRGFSVRRSNARTLDQTISIKLSQGENRIETSVTNVNGIESYRMPLVVNYSPALKQKETTYFIGIGIDKFANAGYNLNYSTKDIRDLAVQLKKKYGNAMVIDTLFNQNVSIGNVKALKQKLMQTTVNDKVIVSYSGHGLLSRNYDYYLSTYLVDFKNPERNGLPYDELEDLLDNIPARKKLMLIDACHSGELDKEAFQKTRANTQALAANHVVSRGGDVSNTETQTQRVGLQNSFELMQNLFVNVGRSTGATVISAASGTEMALEMGNLKNGVFTYCILDALRRYTQMKVSDLKNIVGRRVEELTQGLQKPTSRNETIAVDWNVW